MIDPCKEREPRVIDNALIEKCIDLQYPKGEVGRLLRLEGIPMEEVKEIRFEYLYILKIDHLWVLKSLTKLSLNNNFIEKIENLDTLVNLRELNLSFNKIKRIENLNALINLEKISLYSNMIEEIGNMDNQTKLTVISIGKNYITDRTSVNYFRRFQALTSLNMADNPCAEDPAFRLYVAAYLPDLIYYEYRRIMEEEREYGKELFEESLKNIERHEAAEKETLEIQMKIQHDIEMHSKMFVENLLSGKLFEDMFEDDEEGNAVLEIGDDVTELYNEYRVQFLDLCKQIFDIGQKHFDIREKEIDSFTRSVETMKLKSQGESIEFMESFLEKKNETFQIIRAHQLQLDHGSITEGQYQQKVEEQRKTFQDLIHSTWKNLMRLELSLLEQLEEVNQSFEQIMSEMLNAFIEEVQGVFTNVRATEVTYSENVSDAVIRFSTAANVNPDEQVPPVLKDIIIDRDAINNAMAATHDIHMQTIDGREDTMINRAKTWLQDLTENLTKKEISRNRYKLLEINHFLDIQKEEFDDLTSTNVAAVNVEDV